jgi:carbohydrate kinase (thermoresistant glucokinase family)
MMAGRRGARRPHVVVLGVSGAGKSTVGRRLAEESGRVFADADDFHSAANVTKMAAGIPLTDVDRWPWLESMRDWLAASDEPVVLACSALRCAYRDVLAQAGDVVFVLLDVPREELAARLVARADHFMPASLLDSQLATLERPTADENAIVVDASRGVQQAVDDAVAALGGG